MQEVSTVAASTYRMAEGGAEGHYLHKRYLIHTPIPPWAHAILGNGKLTVHNSATHPHTPHYLQGTLRPTTQRQRPLLTSACAVAMCSWRVGRGMSGLA